MQPTYVVSNNVTLYTGMWVYGLNRTCAETAAVSRGTSHANSVVRRLYHFGGYSKRAGYTHSLRIARDMSVVSLLYKSGLIN